MLPTRTTSRHASLLPIALAALVASSAACTVAAPATSSKGHTSQDGTDDGAGDGAGSPTTTPDPSAPAGGGDHAADIAAFESKVTSLLAATNGNTPGVSVAVVKRGQIAFAKAYGLANVARKEAMTADSIQEVASISKTITALTLLKLVEQGKLSLDDDVQDLLGAPMRNPNHPNDKITPRMLVTHTASIDSTSDAVGRMVDDNWLDDQDATFSVADVVVKTFTPGQTYYDAKNFLAAAPGAQFAYCNVCPAITARIVEKVSGQPFDTFSEETVLKPLGMTSSSWRLARTDRTRLASAYSTWGGAGLEEVPPSGAPYYPAVNFRATASDLGRVLIELASAHKLLGAQTSKDIFTVQFPQADPYQGLAFYEEGNGIFGHSGSNAGEADDYQLRLSDGTGVVVLANGDIEESGQPTYDKIEQALWKLADAL